MRASPHFVYQFWAGEECIYVGCTVNPHARWAHHRGRDWYHLVTRITAERWPDQATARDEEERLIRELQPRQNKVLKSSAPMPPRAAVR